MPVLGELSGDRVRIHTNAVQAFEAWREVDQTFRHSYQGRMNWSRINGVQYLYRITGRSRKSLGPRSPETEQIQADYTAQRTRLRQRRARMAARLKELAPINRAYRLGRVPKMAAGVLRALDTEGLLGEHLVVVGTHSLYAYEAAAGIRFNDDLIATTDIDLLWDARRKLKLALLDTPDSGVMGILRGIDPTFAKSRRDAFRAVNDDGYLVDLIRPLEVDEMQNRLHGVGDDLDLEAAAIMGLQWLINAPRFEHVAIAEDGQPLRMVCIDPRAFALHKHWISQRNDREPDKRRRDAMQALAVAIMAKQNLGLEFKAKDFTALPLGLVQGAKDLARVARTAKR